MQYLYIIIVQCEVPTLDIVALDEIHDGMNLELYYQ